MQPISHGFDVRLPIHRIYKNLDLEYRANESDLILEMSYEPSLLLKPKLIPEMSKGALPCRMLTLDSITHKGRPCVAPSVIIESLETKTIVVNYVNYQNPTEHLFKYVRLTKYFKVVNARFFAVPENLYFKYWTWE